MKSIRVNVRFRRDRGYYELWYKDHATGRRVVKSAETDSPAKAERAAALWQAELEDGKGRRRSGWDAFRLRFEQEHLAPLPPNTKASYDSALNHFESIVGRPGDMAYIDGSTISKLTKGLRDLKLSEERVATVLRHVKAALRFATRIGAMATMPVIIMPKTVKRRFWRSRALTADDLDKMIAAAPAVVGEHAPGWQTLLRGLWLTGLRINEALILSWDSPPLRVEIDGPARPRIVIFGEGQKSREDEISPLTPDAAEFLRTLPGRTGPVFPLTHAAWKITRVNASRVIGMIGREAKLTIDAKGKCVSAHDLRRSFGSRWAMKVPPLALQKMMRHRTLQTTLRFYLELDSDVSDILYGCPNGDQNK